MTLKDLSPRDKLLLWREYEKIMRQQITDHMAFMWINEDTRQYLQDFKGSCLSLFEFMEKKFKEEIITEEKKKKEVAV